MNTRQQTQAKLNDLNGKIDELNLRGLELADKETRSDAEQTEFAEIRAKSRKLIEERATLSELLKSMPPDTEPTETKDGKEIDAEERERRKLRDESLLGNFILAETSGKRLEGKEAEFRAACEVGQGIPLDLFEGREERKPETRADAASVQSADAVGLNLGNIAPAIFANALLPALGCEMPVVPSGSYGQPRITASLSAGPVAKGAAKESTAATIGIPNTTPHRITGRLTLQIEDLMGSGLADMESALRQNLVLVMSDALDTQGLTGDGQGDNITGLFNRVAAAQAAAAVVTFETGVSGVAAFVDGIWAQSKRDLMLVTNPAVYGVASTKYRGNNAETSLADFWENMLGNYRVHARMPAQSAQNKGDALVVRMGQMGVRKAVCPVWAKAITIDDRYSDAAKGQRHLTVHAIVGDVLVAQPDAYKRVSFQTA